MASSYSTNLALELPATGELSGIWGSVVNTNLGTLLEQAISGYVTQAITDGSGANTTITIPNGATGVARNMFLELTGALTFATCSLIVPTNKKLYFIYNNTTGGHPVTVKVTGLIGVAVPNGKKCLLVCNGTDIVEAMNEVVGNLGVGGTLGVAGTLTGAASNFTNITASGTLGVTGNTTLSGTGNVITGTATNDAAAAGKVGEYLESLSPATTTGLTSGVIFNGTTLSLTAGDWNVWGAVDVGFAGGTTLSILVGGMSVTSGALPSATLRVLMDWPAAFAPPSGQITLPVPMQRISLAITANVYIVGQSVFGTSTAGGGGSIMARRIR